MRRRSLRLSPQQPVHGGHHAPHLFPERGRRTVRPRHLDGGERRLDARLALLPVVRSALSARVGLVRGALDQALALEHAHHLQRWSCGSTPVASDSIRWDSGSSRFTEAQAVAASSTNWACVRS